MRNSLQSPTRGGLKRPQSLRPRGIKDKFPDIKLHGRPFGAPMINPKMVKAVRKAFISRQKTPEVA